MKNINAYITSPTPSRPDTIPAVLPPGRRGPVLPTPLAEMKTDHLRPEQAAILRAAIEAAGRWIEERKSRPEASFVVTGPVGTGKTTIAENLRLSSRYMVCAVDWDGKPIPGTETILADGAVIHARVAMALMDGGRLVVEGGEVGRSSLSSALGRAGVIVIDDYGKEELPYVAAADRDTVRQNRYHELVDWIYRRGKSLVVTSEIPFAAGRDFNPDFVNVMGPSAFSRLLERAYGYMFDFSSLPDYRRVLGKMAVRR